MSPITCHVDYRSVCPRCDMVFRTQHVPDHFKPGEESECKRMSARSDNKDVGQRVIVFRRDGVDIAVIRDGAELPAAGWVGGDRQ